MSREPQLGDIVIQNSSTKNHIPEMLKHCIQLSQINYAGERLEFLGYRCEVVATGEGHSWNLYAYFAPPVPKAHLDARNLSGADDIPLWGDRLDDDEVSKRAGLKERRF
jgi:hypothetical protein